VLKIYEVLFFRILELYKKTGQIMIQIYMPIYSYQLPLGSM